jgi:hypothetical protein
MMAEPTRYATELANDPLFASIIDEGKDGIKAPGYNENDLVDPVELTPEQQKKLEDWGL